MQQRKGEAKDEFNARRRQYDNARYANDPAFRARKIEQTKRARDPVRKKETDLLKTYGITLAERDYLLNGQGNVCAICGIDDPGRSKDWNVDHCHETNEVRGILCVRCNFMIGHAKDDPAVLRKAADYLEVANGKGA